MGSMRIPASVLAAVARQLGRPDGVAGRVLGRLLNRGNARVISAAVTAAQAEPGQDVADIGFGGGYGLTRLLEAVRETGVVYGFEIAPTMLAEARRRFRRQVAAGRVQLIDAPMDDLPLPYASLHAAISTNTIYFIDDLPAAFNELARVLKPGGRAVLGVGDPDAMARLPFTPYGFRLRPIPEVTGHLNDAGFQVSDQRAGDDMLASHLLVCQKAGQGFRPDR
jgi:arsenite methyltransferase